MKTIDIQEKIDNIKCHEAASTQTHKFQNQTTF